MIMTVMLVLILLLSLVLEFSMYTKVGWHHKQSLAVVNTLLICFVATVALGTRMNIPAGFVALICAFRILNLFRIVHKRMHDDYLRRATFRTSLWLGILLALSLGVLVYHPSLQITVSGYLQILSVAQLVIATLVFAIAVHNLSKIKHRKIEKYYSDKELPTVTLAIPARNETTDLELCLAAALANDYPKLEIIVLDDCSQGKTADIIRSFAHDGVRFIKGAEPDNHWLPKNQAYERLSQEASGELVLFCGVDVRLGSRAIRSMVTTMLNREKDMISFMPRRLTNTPSAAFIQPMRYWWELVLPRRLFDRPPVLSTAWMVRRKVLKKLGGFKAVSRSVVPERYFARELVTSNKYSFVRADDELDLQTAKSLQEQRSTAIRVRYPQLHKRPELVLLVSTGIFIALLCPFMMLFSSFFFDLGLTAWISLSTIVLLVATHVVIVAESNPPNIPIAFVNLPVVLITELILVYESMLKYEFSEVQWKDRNVCVPVMHVTPHLPKI